MVFEKFDGNDIYLTHGSFTMYVEDASYCQGTRITWCLEYFREDFGFYRYAEADDLEEAHKKYLEFDQEFNLLFNTQQITQNIGVRDGD